MRKKKIILYPNFRTEVYILLYVLPVEPAAVWLYALCLPWALRLTWETFSVQIFQQLLCPVFLLTKPEFPIIREVMILVGSFFLLGELAKRVCKNVLKRFAFVWNALPLNHLKPFLSQLKKTDTIGRTNRAVYQLFSYATMH